MTTCRWVLPDPIEPAEMRKFAAELCVAELTAELLWRRGWREPGIAAVFLQPQLKSLSDPFELPDMARAVERILAAIDRRERIVLYGDYDVDGVTSLALMTRILRALGHEPATFLPHRVDEGYGLSRDGIARCMEECRPQVLIAMDCGTASVPEIAQLQGSGVDVIVVDHHEGKSELPDCVALVNPKRGTDFRYLCTVGLAFKVAHALLKRRPLGGFDLRELLDLVALGTVADLVPLTGENRILVKRGLHQLANSRWVGVRSLVAVSALKPTFAPADVGFGLGPRLNAAGRLGTARDALELLLTEDPGRARTLAASLDQQNRERRAVEESVYQEAEAELATWFDPMVHAAIVVGKRGWHPGVIGIAASRLQKRHHRPTIVVGFDDAGLGKGSGRSIEGLCLVKVLEECNGHLEKFGGHEMAAGLTVRETSFEGFRKAFLAAARLALADEQLYPKLSLDAELSLAGIRTGVLAQLEHLQPFGIGHQQPLFYARAVTLASEPRVLKEKHLSFALRQGRDEVRGIWFGGAATPLPALPWDVAFTVEKNEYQGLVTAQLHVKAVRSAC
jgi:single-stranded-DNA-specific exonuclease